MKLRSRRSFLEAKKLVEEIVADFRGDRKLAVFVNLDLKFHITVENFEGKREYTDQLIGTIREELKNRGLLEKMWLTSTTNSIELNVQGLRTNVVDKLLQYPLKNIVSVGDSPSDIPIFKQTYGIQVPFCDMNIQDITPLEQAKLIAMSPEGGGTTTAKLLMHILETKSNQTLTTKTSSRPSEAS